MVTPLLVEQAPAKLDSKDKSAAPRPSTLTEVDFMIAGGLQTIVIKLVFKSWGFQRLNAKVERWCCCYLQP